MSTEGLLNAGEEEVRPSAVKREAIALLSEWSKTRPNRCFSAQMIGAHGGGLIDLTNKYGANDEIDEQYSTGEFSLWRGYRESKVPKVEIEDTSSPEMKKEAMERLTAFHQMIPVGMSLWLILYFAVALRYLTVDCATNMSNITSKRMLMVTFVPAVVILLYSINHFTVLASRTKFEDRPLVRYISHTATFDNYYLLVFMSVTDVYGKLTRAMFVATICACGRAMHINELFAKWCLATKGVGGNLVVLNGYTDFGWLTLFAFVIGTMVFQTYKFFRSRKVINEALAGVEKRNPDESMGINSCLDDHGALADWALLKPLAAIFFITALPAEFEDNNDCERLWDTLKTKSLTNFVNIASDTLAQLWLMSWYFCLMYENLNFEGRVQMFFSMGATILVTLKAALEMIALRFRLTTLYGVIICLCLVPPVLYVCGGILCDSHQYVILEMSCVELV